MDNELEDAEFVHGIYADQIKKKKELVLDALRTIVDPDLKKNIVELNFVRNLSLSKNKNEKYDVHFDLNLTTPACPVKEDFITKCKNQLYQYEWIEQIDVNITSIRRNEDFIGLNHIENILLVYSCKGGVGKSFVAVNLAFYLNKKGATVGILDADINGPSLPTLLPIPNNFAKCEYVPDVNKRVQNGTNKKGKIFYEHSNLVDSTEKTKDDIDPLDIGGSNSASEEFMIEPLSFEGVKIMSYAYLKNPVSVGFAGYRGPILNQLITEFLHKTNWGHLHYLIVDMPPGTSDIHLDLFSLKNEYESQKKNELDTTDPFSLYPSSQNREASNICAIIVSTPNELAIQDVQKGINMCNFFNIPIVSHIINMSYFICDNCDKKHFIFSSQDSSLDSFKKKHHQLQEIPFHPLFAKNVYILEGKKKFPFLLAFDSSHFLVQHLENIFERIVRETAMVRNKKHVVTVEVSIYKEKFLQLAFDTVKGSSIFSEDLLTCSALEIRLHCECELCEQKSKKEKRRIQLSNILPKQVTKLDTYQVKIEWTDGHISVFTYQQLKQIFIRSTEKKNKNISKCDATVEKRYDW